jgi:hypothetical protein
MAGVCCRLATRELLFGALLRVPIDTYRVVPRSVTLARMHDVEL